MRDLSGVVEQLRNVRDAQRQFLRLWAVEQEVIVPGLDRVAADIDAVAMGPMYGNPSSMNGDNAGYSLGE